MQPINRTFDWGRQGQIEMRPIDEVALSTLAPQPVSTPGVDPRRVVGGRLKQLRDEFKQQADTLKTSGLDVAAHNRVLAGWQNEYDQAKNEQIQIQSQFDLADQAVAAGEMTPEAGREYNIRLIDPELADSMFPPIKAEPRGRFTPSQRGFTGYPEAFEDAQMRALNPDGSYNSAAMKREYFKERMLNGYNQFNSNQKQAYDAMWADQMFDPEIRQRWEEDVKGDPNLYTGRIGPDSSSLMRVAVGKATGQKSISPLGRSVLNKLPKPSRMLPGWKKVRQRLERAGISPQTFDFPGADPGDIGGNQPPKRQYNKRTGQTRISYDGGRTWQIE